MAEKGTSTLLILQSEPVSVRIAQWSGAALLLLEEVGVQVQNLAGLIPVFSFIHRIFLWLVSLTANPF